MYTNNISPSSWFSIVRSKLESWYSALNLNFNTIVQLTLYCVLGFMIGFLSKRYCKFLIFFLIFSTLLLWGLHRLDVISFDIIKLKSLLGILPTDTFDSTMRTWFEWIKVHMLISISI